MTTNSGPLQNIFECTAWHMDPPPVFGTFHIAAALIAVTAAAAGAFYAKRLSSSGRVRFLAVCGWVLVIMEVYKQLFLYCVVNGGTYDWWYFPFQLCSVPMYMCILLPLLCRSADGVRSSAASPVLTFLAVYTFTGAAAALIIPEDYLRSYVTLTLHGFIWHGILLMISLTILLSHMADLTRRGFARATLLFLVMCAAALCINIAVEPLMAASYAEGLIPHSFAAMFYLNPYHLSPQPLVDIIQKSAGIPLGLALYVISIIAVSGLLDLLFRRLFSAPDASRR